MNEKAIELQRIVSELPEYLAERTWLKAIGRPDHNGERVLYWTHHALRTDENPALDVAIHIAGQLKLPLLVYQGLSEQYRFASDRHHTFILEAARELEYKYARLEISYALHVDRAGKRHPRLARLAKTSSVVVTEDFPIEATKRWTDRLAEAMWAPIVLVDTACIVPSRLVGQAYVRAFAFRDATEKLYRDRVNRKWPAFAVKTIPAKLPFETLKLSGQSLAKLVSQCEIDHCVGPVANARGDAFVPETRRSGLAPRRRNRFGVLGHQTFCVLWAQGPRTHGVLQLFEVFVRNHMVVSLYLVGLDIFASVINARSGSKMAN